MRKDDVIEIGGALWKVGRRHAKGTWPLLPLDGTREGGVTDGMVAALPDGVTSARMRTNAMDPDLPRHKLREVGAARVYVWLSTFQEWVPALLSVTAPRQLAVLRELARYPGRWVCAYTLAQAGGWRYSARIHQLRQLGYPIESAWCEHSHHRSRMGSYRLPGIGRNNGSDGTAQGKS